MNKKQKETKKYHKLFILILLVVYLNANSNHENK